MTLPDRCVTKQKCSVYLKKTDNDIKQYRDELCIIMQVQTRITRCDPESMAVWVIVYYVNVVSEFVPRASIVTFLLSYRVPLSIYIVVLLGFTGVFFSRRGVIREENNFLVRKLNSDLIWCSPASYYSSLIFIPIISSVSHSQAFHPAHTHRQTAM